MKIGTIRRILKEDLPADTPSWMDAVLEPLNQFIDTSVRALRNGLTLGDNVSGRVFRIAMTHNEEKEINPAPLRAKIIAVIPMSFGSELLAAYGWRRTQSGLIAVTFQFVNTAAADVDCVFYLLTE